MTNQTISFKCGRCSGLGTESNSKDENGNPFRINRVQAIKDYVEATKADPDKYVVPLEQQEQVAGMNLNPLNTSTKISPQQAMGMSKPETALPTKVQSPKL